SGVGRRARRAERERRRPKGDARRVARRRGAGQAGARWQVDDGRPDGRHVHDHEWRRVRLARLDADPQLPASRHPWPAQDPGPAGRRGRQGRDPADDVRRAVVRPSDHRRPAGRALPRAREGADGRPGVDAGELIPENSNYQIRMTIQFRWAAAAVAALCLAGTARAQRSGTGLEIGVDAALTHTSFDVPGQRGGATEFDLPVQAIRLGFALSPTVWLEPELGLRTVSEDGSFTTATFDVGLPISLSGPVVPSTTQYFVRPL